MKNERKIKMNGKKTSFKEKKQSQDITTPLKSKYVQQKMNKQFSAHRQGKVLHEHTVTRQWKPVIVACIAAIVIGSVLGFMMMNMFGNLESDVVHSNDHPPIKQKQLTENEQKTEASQRDRVTLRAIRTYVLQGGVFSEEKNAQALAKDFQKKNIHTVQWNRDQQFYLFSGLAHTPHEAEQMEQLLLDKGVDVYVKEWVIPEIELQLADEDDQWLQSFHKQWEETVQAWGNGGEVPSEEWKKLLKDSPSPTDLATFIQALQPHVDQLSEADDGLEVASLLLQLLYEYEVFINKQ
ncbi:MAG TPA: hypothetical protein VF095_00175 [Bacillota bacterium]